MNEIPYRRDIDGLRAIAVMAVILFHVSGRFFSAGYLGVDVFFVISGFLITSLIMKDRAFTLAGFWERRARRILPPLLPVLAFSLLAGWVLLLPPDFARFGGQLAAQSVFSSNMLFAHETGYFDFKSGSKPLLHTWSLAVEEQFYLIFPFVLLFLARKKKVAAGIIFLLAASYAACVWGGLYYPEETFYLLPMRAWELLLGAAIVFAPPLKLQRLEREMLAAAGLFFVLYAISGMGETISSTWLAGLMPCLGAAVLIWSGKDSKTFAHKGLSLPPIVGIGLISYSLYLWHWPLLVFASYPPVDGALPWPTVVGAVTLTFVLAYLSWKFIETPVRKKKILKNRKSLFTTLFTMLFSLGIAGAGIATLQGVPARFTPAANAYALAEKDINPRRAECSDRAPEYLAQHGLCHLGKDAPPSFLVFGDSEADAMMPLFDHMARKYGVAGLTASYNSCPAVFGLGRANHAGHMQCRAFNDVVMQAFHDNHIRHIILVGRWYLYMGTHLTEDDREKPASVAKSRVIFRRNLISMVKTLRKNGVDVWIVKSPPEYLFEVPQRLALSAQPDKLGEPIAAHEAYQVNINPVFHDLEKYDVHFVDTAQALCIKGFCITEKDGHALYSDSHHLSTFGALALEPVFARAFRTIKE